MAIGLELGSACAPTSTPIPLSEQMTALPPGILEAHRVRTGAFVLVHAPGRRDSLRKIPGYRPSPIRFTPTMIRYTADRHALLLTGSLTEAMTGMPPEQWEIAIVTPAPGATPPAFVVEYGIIPSTPSASEISIIHFIGPGERLAFMVEGEPALIYDLDELEADVLRGMAAPK